MCVCVQQRDVCACVCTTEGRKYIVLCAAEGVCVSVCACVYSRGEGVFVYTAEGRDVYMCVCVHTAEGRLGREGCDSSHISFFLKI